MASGSSLCLRDTHLEIPFLVRYWNRIRSVDGASFLRKSWIPVYLGNWDISPLLSYLSACSFHQACLPHCLTVLKHLYSNVLPLCHLLPHPLLRSLPVLSLIQKPRMSSTPLSEAVRAGRLSKGEKLFGHLNSKPHWLKV